MPAAASYSAVAIVLHWAIAAAIIGNFALGLWMHGAIDVADSQSRAIEAYQLHKSIGLTVLLLSLVRLLWRLLHKPPPLPDMPAWERLTAKATHWTFYLLMVGIPFSGWLYVSAQWRDDAPLNIPTLWFGLVEIPHLFGLNETSLESRRQLAGIIGESHEILAFGAMALLVLHVGAALKHHFINRDAVLIRMLPLASDDPGRHLALRAGMALIGVALVAAPASLYISAGGSLDDGERITSAGGGWQIDPEASEILFSGVHAGRPFQGRFRRWQASLQLDPDKATESVITAKIETGSATDGVRLHDRSLPEEEWFNVEEYPYATYRATNISQQQGNRYRVEGILTIKGNEIEVAPLMLEITRQKAAIHGQVTIDRTAVDMGMESDPYAEWVSREIRVEVNVTARPPGT